MSRRRFTGEFKSRVVLDVFNGTRTLSEIAQKYKVHPMVVTKWKKHAVDCLPELFSKKSDLDKEKWKEKEATLFQEIGQLKYELDWLKKKTDLNY